MLILLKPDIAHELGKLAGQQGLKCITAGLFRARVHLDDEAVRTGRHGSSCEVWHQIVMPSRVAWIHHDGQAHAPLEVGDGAQVEHRSHVAANALHATLAQNHLLVARVE